MFASCAPGNYDSRITQFIDYYKVKTLAKYFRNNKNVS